MQLGSAFPLAGCLLIQIWLAVCMSINPNRRNDSTATVSEEQTAQKEERLLAEQACSNAIFRKQWKKAITLALKLEQVRDSVHCHVSPPVSRNRRHHRHRASSRQADRCI
jgi:hypothetical protein